MNQSAILACEMFINSSAPYQSGVDARFKRCISTPKIGYKIYHSERKFNIQYYNQKWASEFGIAPKVGNKFILQTQENHYGETECFNWFGFETEAVDFTLRNYLETVPYDEYHEVYDRIVRLVSKDLEYINIIPCDMHSDNIGGIRLPNGNIKWMVIDFGHCDYKDESGEYLNYPGQKRETS